MGTNRHPGTVAWDAFEAANPSTTNGATIGVSQRNQQFLENRLRAAFIAGWNAAEAHLKGDG